MESDGRGRPARPAGLAAGERVLLYYANSVEAVVTMFGIAKAGLVVVPVIDRLDSAAT
ncbi:AMP-binding protein [Rhodococcus ruber]|uniref:AMP-binding protein n=1 Tax=Rhodococcus TaxID=1827 RepID=UPI0002D486F3|nr:MULTISPECIES: AMP-binding protein [Rhodococcus]MCZ1074461.1 AMP-binding protein [Rhodococcus sp. A5(2022)]UIR35021.1 long-chain fatty acid--CoA ligase [Rhodococcus sp. DMF-1]